MFRWNKCSKYAIDWKEQYLLWLFYIAGDRIGYRLRLRIIVLQTQIGSRDLSPSLCNVNMFCIVQCSHPVWNLSLSLSMQMSQIKMKNYISIEYTCTVFTLMVSHFVLYGVCLAIQCHSCDVVRNRFWPSDHLLFSGKTASTKSCFNRNLF